MENRVERTFPREWWPSASFRGSKFLFLSYRYYTNSPFIVGSLESTYQPSAPGSSIPRRVICHNFWNIARRHPRAWWKEGCYDSFYWLVWPSGPRETRVYALGHGMAIPESHSPQNVNEKWWRVCYLGIVDLSPLSPLILIVPSSVMNQLAMTARKMLTG